MSKYFLFFFPPDSFSLQTRAQAAGTSAWYKLPHRNHRSPGWEDEKEGERDDNEPPNSPWREWHLWNTPSPLLKAYLWLFVTVWGQDSTFYWVYDFLSIWTFKAWICLLLKPSLRWEGVKFIRILILTRERVVFSLRLPLVPTNVTLTIHGIVVLVPQFEISWPMHQVMLWIWHWPNRTH